MQKPILKNFLKIIFINNKENSKQQKWGKVTGLMIKPSPSARHLPE